jgi:hypothetical protein
LGATSSPSRSLAFLEDVDLPPDDAARRFADELARRLCERVHAEVVPGMARGLAAARGLTRPTAKDLAETYEMAMTVLFRLLFIAYAEDNDLLPYRWNRRYRARSLKTRAQQLAKRFPHGIVSAGGESVFGEGASSWEAVRALFTVVREGNADWGVPKYDGGLFGEDPHVSRVGALLAGLSLPDAVMRPILWHLLVIETPEGARPVDFRSLSVREFGTIYEGLLESELSVAEVPLTLDERGFYRPCRAAEEPLVRKQEIYLHNRSGARKATGTYFTREFAVEHLLDHALEPALAEHLARLDGLADEDAAERFFDFRVADIAMGSGHFLVAAVDRIERAFLRALAERPLAGVTRELARLREVATEAPGRLAPQAEDARLLRRLIAERCIYGVDLNPVAVNLARLSLWTHTFVPGLPPSPLDHNLVVGNALAGNGPPLESEDRASLDFPAAFPEVFLRDRAGFDVLLGNPPWKTPIVHEVAFWARHFPGLRSLPQAEALAQREALARERPDLVERLRREAGEADALRQALTDGAYPKMGVGDPDLYKAFAWRCWELVARDGGWVGLVLPRSACAAKGSTAFRKEVLAGAAPLDLTMLVNNRQWVFPEVHPQYTVALVAMRRATPQGRSVLLRGPFTSEEQYAEGVRKPAHAFTPAEVMGWNDTASVPLLPSEESLDVFTTLRAAPRLDLDDGRSWRARPYGEAHSAKCQGYLLPPGTRTATSWPVLKGESFDLERCEGGGVFGYAEPEVMGAWLEGARRRRVRGSAYAEFPASWANDAKAAPWRHCRVVYRDVARATDTRTLIVTVVPPHVFLTDKAPYFLFPRGTIADQLYLYGVLRSLPLDWYARRFVETAVKFYLVNALPVPRPPASDPRRRRVVALVGRMACVDGRFAEWARAVGVECGPLPQHDRREHVHELDAVVAQLYGLEEKQLVHIFETFHVGWDYGERLEATLRHYRAWRARRKRASTR